MDEIIRTSHLEKRYESGTTEVTALADIALSVQEGEFIAIMGASGSGKSTLLHLLGGLDTPSSGEVVLRGQGLSSLSDRKITLLRRKAIGFVFQFYNLLPTLSAAENIALPLVLDGKKPKECQEKALNLLKLVGLEKRKAHKPDELSGGEQQRVAIARALVTEPALVLADEPSGNLNSKAGKEILTLLRASCDNMGQTIVMVTHDAHAATYADRVIFLKDGQIAGQLKLGKERDAEPILRKLQELEI